MKQDLMTPQLAAYNKKNGIISGAWVVNARRDKVHIYQSYDSVVVCNGNDVYGLV
jgi:hypothetical protein